MTDSSTLKGKKIFVAGGTGLVGTNLTQRLHHAGVKVSASYHIQQPHILPHCYKPYDFMQFEDCLKATQGMDYVILCAARSTGIKARKENPTGSILPNLEMTAGLLEACYQNKVQKVVLISSSTIYQPCQRPLAENELDLNQPPHELYFGVGWVYRYLEQLAAFYHRSQGMKVGILRPSNIYGPYDKFDDRSNVLPGLIQRALNRENPFLVWGDGKTIRDFIFVEDFIDDLLWVLDHHCQCDPVNSGSGVAMEINEAAKIVLDVCGHQASIQLDPSKPVAVPYSMLNVSKRDQLMRKRPMMPLKDGISRTVQWYLEYKAQSIYN